MYDLVSEQDGRALGIHMRGELSDEAADELNAFLTDRTTRHDRLAVLFEVDELSPDDAATVMERLDLEVPDAEVVDRVAVVGDETWERWESTLAARFPQAEIQFYAGSHLAEAWAWVRGKV